MILERERMLRFAFCCTLLLLAGTFGFAQDKEKAKAKDAQPPAPTFSTRLPSEETVNAFMKQMFGYDPSVSWKVASIRPTEAQGIAEVIVVVSNPQGQQNNRLYVTSDGKHALVGDIIPFGVRPFDATRDDLAISAPFASTIYVTRAGRRPGNRRRIQRPAMPALQGSAAHR